MKQLLESPEKKLVWWKELGEMMVRELLNILLTVILNRRRRTARPG